MKFTAVSAVSLLAGSAFAAPTDINANKASDMSADASSIANMRLADVFDERQMAVLKILSRHQQELGMSQEEKMMMDAFMAALHGEAVNDKRQAPVAVPVLGPVSLPTVITAPIPTVITAPIPAGSATDLLSILKNIPALGGLLANATGAASGVANTAAGAAGSATNVLNILKNIPALAPLLANLTGAVGGATSGLGSATSGLSGLTGGSGALNGTVGGLTGGLGGLTGGLGGLTGGLGGACGGVRRGGLLGGILIPGIL